jgi:hypothetical protein
MKAINKDTLDNDGWTNRVTTSDQQDIEAYLVTLEPVDARIFHVGVGNSSLAQRFEDKNTIHGITVHASEKTRADSLGIDGYVVELIDKADPELPHRFPHEYDYVIDNNLGSYTPSEDIDEVIKNMFTLLKTGGKLLGHSSGWEYTLTGEKMHGDRVAETASKFGFKTKQENHNRIEVITKL